MQACLYTPQLGYYQAGKATIGPAGDFTTAPEISPLFAKAMAKQIADVYHQIRGDRVLLEFGAGRGTLALGLITALQAENVPLSAYWIIETSPTLKHLQYETLAAALPHFIDHIHWLDHLPDQFTGVIIANEVCDAMPVERLQFSGETTLQQMITIHQGQLSSQWHAINDERLVRRAAAIEPLIPAAQPYQVEINFAAEAWISSIATILTQGAAFIVDYGYSQNTLYHPQRSQGTLMCYYQHQGHDDPLLWPGLQDITAHLNYTALAEVAHQQGLHVAGFHHQADFLLAADITAILGTVQHDLDPLAQLQESAAVKQLLLPSAMGENFKVLTLTRALPELLTRLQSTDRRYQL